MLVTIRKRIDEYYHIIRNPIMLLLFLVMTDNVNSFGTTFHAIFNIMLYYTMVIYIISQYGNDSRYLLLGVSISFFLSEYWEIPIYLWQILVRGTYRDNNVIQNLFLLERFLVKIATFYYVIWNIKSIGLDHKGFIKDLFVYSVIYIPIVFITFTFVGSNTFFGIDFNWSYRLICLGMVLQYLYKEGINNTVG
jgi:hypothetical protein